MTKPTGSNNDSSSSFSAKDAGVPQKSDSHRHPSPKDVIIIDLLDDDDPSTPSAGQSLPQASAIGIAQPSDEASSIGLSSAGLRHPLDSLRKRMHEDGQSTSPTCGPISKMVKQEALVGDLLKKPLKDDHDDDNDIVVLESHPSLVLCPPAAAAAVQETGDLQVVATKNAVRLPHMRPHCTVYPLSTATARQFCEDCYCYVCDVKVSQCRQWENYHCQATDQGSRGAYWQTLRQNARQARARKPLATVPSTTGAAVLSQANSRTHSDHKNSPKEPSLPPGQGPFPPDHPWFVNRKPHHLDQVDLVPCRKCAWYNYRLWPHNQIISSRDWCLACGRIASDDLLEKIQDQAKEPVDQNYYLGTKKIAFTLQVRDPRTSSKYAQRWKECDGQQARWQPYNVQDMEEDLFHHRIGPRPQLWVLLASIPTTLTHHHHANPNNDMDQEAILLSSQADLILLQELMFCKKNSDTNRIIISASWDRSRRQGLLEIKLWSLHSRTPSTFTRLISAWYGILPVPMNEMNLLLEARPNVVKNQKGKPGSADELAEKKHQEQVLLANELRAQRQASLSLESSVKGQGGICTNERDLQGVMMRYYRECLPEIIASNAKIYHWDELVRMRNDLLSGKVVTTHKRIPGTWSSDEERLLDGGIWMDPVLSLDDYCTAYSMMQDAKKFLCPGNTVENLMAHMENLGHAVAPYVEGLTVDLLPFQRQTLQWALERETTPGGIQTFWWTKLPDQDLYFNPVLGQVRKEKPRVVKGGIIAEQMGLGKTVISLALILSNPAPAQPTSGSPSSLISQEAAAEDKPGWTLDLSTSSKSKRGQIVSRGTLVVCNVSLVGQWMAEAKSKLSNPGLVYAYHGSRKRDPNILAQNAIVVTTYETLASDMTYHAQKAADPEHYCPPCEQVAWWRVICDESHSLRYEKNGKCRAVMSLVAENKWLVSGTPISTSIKDLQNQLKFLGIEYISETMKQFSKALEPSSCPSIGPFAFMMRSIMMRHSQQQKYQGTSTTLMSLPPKHEHVIHVDLSATERMEYSILENKARAFCLTFAGDFSKNYLALLQKLVPLRVACAGGQVPLENEKRDPNDEVTDDEEEKPARVVKYSDFAFTSKLLKLVSELNQIRTKDPTSKSLVFSQFTSTLKWLQGELPKHGYQYRILSGDMTRSQRTKALDAFQNDPPTTVFLLSMRAGAVGINLTQANHVFLMEPCVNPALELQAIGRVYRLGQKRPVKVIRMMVNNSVESRTVKMLEKKYGGSDQAGAQDSGWGVSVAVGSLKSDKAVMLEAEFRLLFGLDEVATEDAPQVVPGSDPRQIKKEPTHRF